MTITSTTAKNIAEPSEKMPRALIIGGGIGGLTAALAFRQKGWDVAVYEAAPELRPVGKGIWVSANAMQNPLARCLRDLALRWTPERVNHKQLDRLCRLDHGR